MRRLVKWLLFGNSYTPLFVILLLKDFNQGFRTPWFSYTLLIIVILSNLTLIFLLKESKRLEPEPYVVSKVVTRNSESLNYIVTYIIPFLSFDLSSTVDILSLLILLLVMALIYVNSDLLYTNPMLSIIGYRIFQVQTDTEDTMIFISKKERTNRKKIKGVHLTDDIYLEV